MISIKTDRNLKLDYNDFPQKRQLPNHNVVVQFGAS